MKLYGLVSAPESRHSFAQLFITEPLHWFGPKPVCQKCLRPLHLSRRPGLSITWKPGSSVISDFVYFGRDCFIVTDRVKKTLDDASVSGYVAAPVRIVEPTRRGKSQWPIVSCSYNEPCLWDLYIPSTAMANLIPSESTVECFGPCIACGTMRYEPDTTVDQAHYVIDRDTWHGRDFIIAEELSGVFVNDRVIQQLRDFTNVTAVEEGRIG